jgi:hypothetical protein
MRVSAPAAPESCSPALLPPPPPCRTSLYLPLYPRARARSLHPQHLSVFFNLAARYMHRNNAAFRREEKRRGDTRRESMRSYQTPCHKTPACERGECERGVFEWRHSVTRHKHAVTRYEHASSLSQEHAWSLSHNTTLVAGTSHHNAFACHTVSA